MTEAAVAKGGVSTTFDKKMKGVSKWAALPGLKESAPGLIAMFVIAMFCEMPGLPWPFTVEVVLKYIDHVLPPINGKGLFVDLLHFMEDAKRKD